MFLLHIFIELENKKCGQHRLLMLRVINFLLTIDKTLEYFHTIIINISGLDLLLIIHTFPYKE